MEQNITVVGLDTSKKTLVTGVLLPGMDRVTESKVIPNDPKAIEREVQRLVVRGPAVFVYEAGPCGYALYRQITQMDRRCAVVAPGLIPKRPTDRVKNDRRDAEKLARLYRAGELTEVRVPTPEEEAARDLLRAREDILADRLRARHRLSKLLLRQGQIYSRTQKRWGVKHWGWLKEQRFEWAPLQQTFEACVRACQEAQAHLDTLDQQVQDLAQVEPYRTPVQHLRCLKGVDTLIALTLVVEIQDFRRFETASAFMGFTGLVSSEHSSGETVWRGGITKAGNAHLRRVLVESAWCNRNNNVVSQNLATRRQGCPPEVLQIARAAQNRLHRKYWRLAGRGKPHSVVVAAVARELAGFVWAVGRQTPRLAAA